VASCFIGLSRLDVRQTGALVLLTLQVPIADLRPFSSGSAERQPLPAWPQPVPYEQFVPRFGAVQRRTRGASGVEEWADEVYFSSAANALKFPDLNQRWMRSPKVHAKPFGAFRRFLSDGCAVARVEIGVQTGTRQRDVDGTEALGLVREFLSLPTNIARPLDVPRPRALIHQRHNLRRLYLMSSTPKEARERSGDIERLVSTLSPLVIVKYDFDPATGRRELNPLPSRAKTIDPPPFPTVLLSHTRLAFAGGDVGVWFLGAYDRDRISTRQVRLCILRLHAEQAVLQHVLSKLRSGELPFKPRSKEGDRLEKYLNDATRVLGKSERHGVAQEALRAVMNAFDVGIGKDERQVLMAVLDDARLQIKKKVDQFLIEQRNRREQSYYVATDGKITNAEIVIMDNRSVTNTTIDFGQGNTFHGSVTAAGHIERSFNAAKDVTNNELQKSMEELVKKVGALASKLPPDDQEVVTRKLEQFTQEAKAKKPDRNVLKVTGEGLIEAAKTVAAMAEPVGKAVLAILGILGVAP
jgi:hypothetical protein